MFKVKLDKFIQFVISKTSVSEWYRQTSMDSFHSNVYNH